MYHRDTLNAVLTRRRELFGELCGQILGYQLVPGQENRITTGVRSHWPALIILVPVVNLDLAKYITSQQGPLPLFTTSRWHRCRHLPIASRRGNLALRSSPFTSDEQGTSSGHHSSFVRTSSKETVLEVEIRKTLHIQYSTTSSKNRYPI